MVQGTRVHVDVEQGFRHADMMLVMTVEMTATWWPWKNASIMQYFTCTCDMV